MIGEILARRRTRTWLAATAIVIILGVLAFAATGLSPASGPVSGRVHVRG